MTKIGIIAGSFKPFHKGHFALVNIASKENDIVELFISLSTRSRPGELVVKGESMTQIWQKYIEPFLPSNVIVNYVPVPIRSAYEAMQEREEQNVEDVIFSIYSDSDDVMGNFPVKNLEKYMPRLLQRNQIKIRNFDREKFINASGTAVRKAILSGDKEQFLSMMPNEIDSESIWEILSSDIEIAPEKVVKKKKKITEVFKFRQFKEYLDDAVINILVSNYSTPAGDNDLQWQFTDAMPANIRGRYVIQAQKLLINTKKSSEQLKSQVRTILHEIEHWNQHALHMMATESIHVATDRYVKAYKSNVAKYGYWNAPEEVEARQFAETNLQDALKLINDFYTGKDIEATPDEVVEEIFDLYERNPKKPVTRFMIGTALSDYAINNKQNLEYVINFLKDLGVPIT